MSGEKKGPFFWVSRLGRLFLSCVVVTGSIYLLAACDVEEEIDDDDEIVSPSTEYQFDMDFALVPAGTFDMGSPATEIGRRDDEVLHEVTISEDFYLQTTEVTQAQWEEVMGYNPVDSPCDNCPVHSVSWNDVQVFILALSEGDGATYRLPTEAEWEYGARAGSTTGFANGDLMDLTCEDIDDNLDLIGWFRCNSDNALQAVSGKDRNSQGLYDMHGNVAEWVQDYYAAYSVDPVTDPTGPDTGMSRVVRGGGYSSLAHDCRSAARADYASFDSQVSIGFRLVCIQQCAE